MQIRHRTPTIFSIYMVDVMCCALGCVILLWQVNRQEAETRNEELQKAHVQISSLDDSSKGLAARLKQSEDGKVKLEIELKGQVAKNEKLAIVLEREKDELNNLRKTHEMALALVNNLKIDVKGLKDEVLGLKNINATLDSEKSKTALSLSAKTEEFAKLLKKLTDAEGKVTILSKEAADKSVELSDLDKKFRDITGQLSKKEQELLLNQLSSKEVLETLKKSNLRILTLEGENKALSAFLKDLDAAKLSIADLNKEKLALLGRVQSAEARFAGMTLTGKKVVFLVDMSGSMVLVDENTSDPDKWPTVCDTVARVMDSLTDLDSFQIIMFSNSIAYPLGERGRFIKYRSKDQVKNLATVLKSIKPVGGTNMYDALNEAFKLRDQGLDTIYLFSDGLPNLGEGLPTNSSQLNEQQKTDQLSRFIRTRLKTVWNRPDPVKVKINTVGFFFESPEVGAFLWALSRENDGSFVGMK